MAMVVCAWPATGRRVEVGYNTDLLPRAYVPFAIEALQEWALPPITFTRREADAPGTITFYLKDFGRWRTYATAFPPCLGQEPDRGDVWLDSAVDWLQWPDLLRSVLMHEVGHALGLPDLGVPGAVMTAPRPFPMQLTAADLLHFRKLYPFPRAGYRGSGTR